MESKGDCAYCKSASLEPRLTTVPSVVTVEFWTVADQSLMRREISRTFNVEAGLMGHVSWRDY